MNIVVKRVISVHKIKQNSCFHRPEKSKNDRKPTGMFRNFDNLLRHAIILVNMKDVTSTRRRNTKDLELQAKARCEREELSGMENMNGRKEEESRRGSQWASYY